MLFSVVVCMFVQWGWLLCDFVPSIFFVGILLFIVVIIIFHFNDQVIIAYVFLLALCCIPVWVAPLEARACYMLYFLHSSCCFIMPSWVPSLIQVDCCFFLLLLFWFCCCFVVHSLGCLIWYRCGWLLCLVRKKLRDFTRGLT